MAKKAPIIPGFRRAPRAAQRPTDTPAASRPAEAAGNAPTAGRPDALTAVRHEQAARLRRLNELEAGRLAPIEEVARRWSEIASQIRTGLLSVPSRIGARFPGQPDFVRAVDEEIRLALNDLADDRDGGL